MGLWVVALGGNAILQPKQKGTASEQWANVTAAVQQVLQIRNMGHTIVLTHGNGPQVGNILKQQETAAPAIPPLPLDLCGAQTQGMLGYMLQHTVNRLLAGSAERPQAVALVTQVAVDAQDPAFRQPSKPIGGFVDEGTAREHMTRGETWVEDAGRGWRRVVASPQPRAIVNLHAIQHLVAHGFLVIAAGGGGIPAAHEDSGLAPVEAVIDKDRTASLLASGLGAAGLLILTDVEQVCLHYRTPQEQPLAAITATQAQRYLDEGHFQRGSMGPKIEAAITMARRRGVGIIAKLDQAVAALAGTSGTRIVPDGHDTTAFSASANTPRT